MGAEYPSDAHYWEPFISENPNYHKEIFEFANMSQAEYLSIVNQFGHFINRYRGSDQATWTADHELARKILDTISGRDNMT